MRHMSVLLRTFFSVLDQRQCLIFGILFLCNLGTALLEILSLGALIPFIVVLIDPQQGAGYPVLQTLSAWVPVTDRIRFLGIASLVIVFLFTLKNVLALGLEWARTRFANRSKRILAGRLFRSYLTRPYSWHLTRNSTVLLHHVNTLPVAFHTTALMIFGIINTSLILAGIFVFLLWLDPLAFIILGLVLGAAATVFIRWSNQLLEKLGGRILTLGGRLNLTVIQGLGGIKETRILGREEHFLDRYNREACSLEEDDSLYSVISMTPRHTLEIVTILTVLGVMMMMVYQGDSPQAIVMKISVFGVAAFRLLPAITTLVNSLSYLSFGHAGLTQLAVDLQDGSPAGQAVPRDDEPDLPFRSMVSLHGVGFRYPDTEEPVIHGLDVTIPRNRSVGFVGASGVGKTTTVDLLLGLLEPTEGEIRVDGCSIAAHISAWQRKLGYIPQEIFLADATLRENIAFAVDADGIDDGQVWNCLKMAQLDAFVKTLPDELNTVIGEAGVRFSGGQRQRIGIARALYHRPELLVMDEATAALDSETEKELLQSIAALEGKVTLVIIAHRLTTVKHCDRIFLMRGGRIADQGTWDELLARNTQFRRLAAVEG